MSSGLAQSFLLWLLTLCDMTGKALNAPRLFFKLPSNFFLAFVQTYTKVERRKEAAVPSTTSTAIRTGQSGFSRGSRR